MRVFLLTILVVTSLVVPQALLGSRSVDAAECVRPEPLPLPLRDLPQTRIEFGRYKEAVRDYQACAGADADPTVQAEYEAVLKNWIWLVRVWGHRHGR